MARRIIAAVHQHRNASSARLGQHKESSSPPGLLEQQAASNQRRSQRRPTAAIVSSAVGAGFLLLVLVLVILVYRRVKRSSARTISPASEQQSPIRLRRFSYRELRSATGRFSDSHKLGQGGFGSVFKGTLKNGQHIAVKKLDTASLQGEREFMNELSIMGSMASSPFVVGLIGFCADSKRKMLVYEFMANRSLQEILFDEKHSVVLQWERRAKIVADVARALAFLHGKCEPPIVHGDVKPSNVLLGADFGAKLADFGLARVKTQESAAVDERERVRSQRIARDRERRRKKDHHQSRAHPATRVLEQHEDEESDPPVLPDRGAPATAASPDPVGSADHTTIKNVEEGDERTTNERSGEESQGSPELQAGDPGSSDSKSPVLSPSKQAAADHENDDFGKVSRGGAATPSSIGGGQDDDEEWSKLSQSAYGTEADTWSKISPSEIDCRSEISFDGTGQGQAGIKNFLGRKKPWGQRKASASPSSGNGKNTNNGSRDWWWKQESSGQQGGGGGEFSIREYIVDWVSCENRRGRSRTREWPWNAASSGTAGAAAAGTSSEGKNNVKKKKKQARSGSLEWWAECDDDDELAKRIKAEQKRKKKLRKEQEKLAMSVSRESSRDWWRRDRDQPVEYHGPDEFSGEILKNGGGGGIKRRSMSEESFTFYHSGDFNNSKAATNSDTNINTNDTNSNTNNPSNSMELLATLGNSGGAAAALINSDDHSRRRVRTRSREWWSGEMQRGKEWWSGELTSNETNNNRKGGRLFETWSRESLSGELTRRRRRERSRSHSRDWWSGDLVSRVSSTPSMRGTVCYVAPEYGGGGVLTEKSDVYSFGVLLLVVVSGRRPLQVVAAPLSEFERANLISWARHAAQAGRGLDLVDPLLAGAYSKEQATLFISLALLCLQRVPSLRPSMSDVVKIFSGEAELPALPFEFSPSPPGCGFKSRRKASAEHVAVDMPS
ncbi:receptor-like serine/threonine-protein kinase At2g45590 [Selaginella moellendorffii]|uniref:receptor-like serine/threonine-protein kinase At2g45590 n=1 Tax=Selaginella moellendorffii TaxID=88036 RepID=UPI000D1C3BF5|nr:receptor-like serine/threonine-protein kinase At2g45590 [Selaginella moellendorffii]|eukprot:XP_024542789.1 receptor-like serine/threonine-protein kinase At2g45590 [Selaginella moellendorffii]